MVLHDQEIKQKNFSKIYLQFVNFAEKFRFVNYEILK